jgi:hypothetical protein
LADAVSFESSCFGQGLLTYSLLLEMRGVALREDDLIDVGRIFKFSADQNLFFGLMLGVDLVQDRKQVSG